MKNKLVVFLGMFMLIGFVSASGANRANEIAVNTTKPMIFNSTLGYSFENAPVNVTILYENGVRLLNKTYADTLYNPLGSYMLSTSKPNIDASNITTGVLLWGLMPVGTLNKTYADTIYNPIGSYMLSTTKPNIDAANITTGTLGWILMPSGTLNKTYADTLYAAIGSGGYNDVWVVNNVSNLWTNASDQQLHITNLWLNASDQQSHITNLWINATNQDARIKVTEDKFGTLTNTKWCTGTASGFQCTSDAPANANDVYTNITALQANSTNLLTNASNQESRINSLESKSTNTYTNITALQANVTNLLTNDSNQESRISTLEVKPILWVDSGGYIKSNSSIDGGDVFINDTLNLFSTNLRSKTNSFEIYEVNAITDHNNVDIAGDNINLYKRYHSGESEFNVDTVVNVSGNLSVSQNIFVVSGNINNTGNYTFSDGSGLFRNSTHTFLKG